MVPLDGLIEHEHQIPPGIDQFRVNLEGLVKVFNRRFHPSLFDQSHSQVIVSLGPLGIDPQRLLEVLHGLIHSSLLQ